MNVYPLEDFVNVYPPVFGQIFNEVTQKTHNIHDHSDSKNLVGEIFAPKKKEGQNSHLLNFSNFQIFSYYFYS